jgi:hypothetical protein
VTTAFKKSPRYAFRIVFDDKGVPVVDTKVSDVCVRLWPTPDVDANAAKNATTSTPDNIAWVLGPTDCIAYIEKASPSAAHLKGRRDERRPIRKLASSGFIEGFLTREND